MRVEAHERRAGGPLQEKHKIVPEEQPAPCKGALHTRGKGNAIKENSKMERKLILLKGKQKICTILKIPIKIIALAGG